METNIIVLFSYQVFHQNAYSLHEQNRCLSPSSDQQECSDFLANRVLQVITVSVLEPHIGGIEMDAGSPRHVRSARQVHGRVVDKVCTVGPGEDPGAGLPQAGGVGILLCETWESFSIREEV